MDDHLSIQTINNDGYTSGQELFMSYGLLNQLAAVVGSMERIIVVDTDPDLSATVIQIMLVPRHPSGKPKVDLATYEAPGLTQEIAEKILDWAKEHLLSFFSRRVQATVKLLDANKDQLTAIGSSLIGSIPAPSSKPSS